VTVLEDHLSFDDGRSNFRRIRRRRGRGAVIILGRDVGRLLVVVTPSAESVCA